MLPLISTVHTIAKILYKILYVFMHMVFVGPSHTAFPSFLLSTLLFHLLLLIFDFWHEWVVKHAAKITHPCPRRRSSVSHSNRNKQKLLVLAPPNPLYLKVFMV